MDLRRGAFLFLLCAATLSFSADMSVTLGDGRTVTLRPDSTWDYQGSQGTVGEDGNQALALPDGKTLLLREDGSWAIGRGLKAQPSAILRIKQDEVSASASASKGSVSVSSKAATDLCISKIIDQVNAQVKHPKIKRADVEQCVRAEIKEQQIETTLQANNAVTAHITLDRMQMRNVTTCLQEVLAAAMADTTKKAGK